MSVSPNLMIDPVLLVGRSFRRASQGSPAEFRLAFEQLRVAYPKEVAKLCVVHIAERGLDLVGRKIASWLSSEDLYLAPLYDPRLLPIESARSVLEVFRGFDAQFSPKFSKLLTPQNRDSDVVVLTRSLELLVGLQSYEIFLPHLQALTKYGDGYVRSKAVKALCRIRPNKALIERLSQCDDPRIRANALEAIWHMKTEEAKAILEASSVDADHRVVMNALVGLYYVNEPTALDRIIQYSQDESIGFRRAAVWAFGLIADPRSREALEKMLTDSSPVIQTNARRALAKLQAAPGKVEEEKKQTDLPATPTILTEVQTVAADEQPVEATSLPAPAFRVL